MNKFFILITIVILVSGFCKSQTSTKSITGKYIGQSVNDLGVITIEVKKNHNYILRTYDLNRKKQNKVKGKWIINENTLVLIEKNGIKMILEKNKDVWYITDKTGNICVAKFYQNVNHDEFWAELIRSGC